MHALKKNRTALSFPFLSVGGILEVPEERCPSFKFSSRISDLWLSEMHNPLRLHYELFKRDTAKLRCRGITHQQHFLMLEFY